MKALASSAMQPLSQRVRALKKYKFDDKRIVAEFSIRRSMKKERTGIEYDRRRLEERIRKVKDVLPLAEQSLSEKSTSFYYLCISGIS
ncbi:MAG: hypothetical protein WCC17_11945 [Candidatus Nitrosopolaris sp.]|jgi:hypothetical protein